jgi:hypothetical protein
MASGPRGVSDAETFSLASRSSCPISMAKGSNCSPAAVSFTPRECRSNSATPSSVSSFLMRLVTFDCTVFSLAAAPANEAAWLTAMKNSRSTLCIAISHSDSCHPIKLFQECQSGH